ncbi:MAG: putative transport protein TqsA [Chloroflexi bacterium]|nr:putative transport protein TqsA [Chloroflexota bacterium]
MNKLSGRLVVYLVGGAAIFVILFGIRGSAYIINPILLAAVITITVLPVPGRLTKRGLPGWLALVLTIGMVVLILLLVIATVFFSITKLTTEIPAYTTSASQQTTEEPATDSATETTTQPSEVSVQVGEIAQGVIASVLNLLVQFGWALVIFFFMISAAITLPKPSRLGLDPNAPTIGRITHLTEDVRKYMTVLTGINLLVGLGDTIFLLLLGVDYALLWGLLAWFMGYIPSIGFIIALIPPVLMAYAQYGLETALIVLVGYILINGGVQNFIQPKLMGQRLKISPVVVFVGLFIWGYLLGGIGALLAVPLTLLVLIIMENFEGTRPLAILMRYTGEEKEEERKQAEQHVKGLWGKLRGTFSSDRESEDLNK